MTDPEPYHSRGRIAALVAGLLVAVILAMGLGAIAFASARGAKPQRMSVVTGSIRLQHREVRSGRSVRGELVFENHTSKTKVLMRGCKIDGLYAIGLRASDGYLQTPAFSAVGCTTKQEMVARPGATVYRFKMPATYTQCSQSPERQPPRRSKYWTPLCLKDPSGERDVMPPLPPGRYTALFFADGEWHGPHIESADLVVTRTKWASGSGVAPANRSRQLAIHSRNGSRCGDRQTAAVGYQRR
jgi:hypothetical protein